MQFLVNDILDFAQFENKKFLLNTQHGVEIRNLIKDCIEVLEFKADAKLVKLRCLVDPEFPEQIATDPDRLRQIIMNLASNAIKYTKEGEILIKASIDKNAFILQVKDTGVGIKPNRLGCLFTAFTKILRHRELNQQGLGLGLTICKNLANALGGDIYVESKLNVGSTFTVRVPLLPGVAIDECSQFQTTENIKVVQGTLCKHKELEGLVGGDVSYFPTKKLNSTIHEEDINNTS